MLGYYLSLARRSLKRNKGLTVLMIVAIAFGVGASMTTLTVLHVLAADPIPAKSHQLYYVQLDPQPLNGYRVGDEPPYQVSRYDAEALVRAQRADRQALMTGGNAAIEPDRTDIKPFFAEGRWTSSEMFAMFDIPFLAGTSWTADDDLHAARVAVISRALAEKLFGSTAAVGRTLHVEGQQLRVIGVIADWVPHPHFYDLNTSRYGKGEQLFVPFSTSRELKLSRSGSMDCWKESGADSTALDSPCVWLQLWVELDSPDKASAYRDFLVSYSEDQLRSGRYQRPPNVRLRDVIGWLELNKVVPPDARLQTWIALGFLLVCLVNTVGLLLTKFVRRSSEIGVRRALGASKRTIFIQLLVEAGMIGLAGALLGLGLAWLGLWGVRHQPAEYAPLAHLDLPMLAATFGLAITSSVLAGLLPAWRGCQASPAIQLKSH
ncbi:MAG TPA: ABC transporter permease [Kofleriaceae bacterium]|jgi:putative ABC transport system permease protein